MPTVVGSPSGPGAKRRRTEMLRDAPPVGEQPDRHLDVALDGHVGGRHAAHRRDAAR
jgi:hypothetical protein